MTAINSQTALIPAARMEGDALVAGVKGEIDLNNSPELRLALLNLIGEHSPRRLVLNLAGVPYMDSSALAVLVEMRRKLAKPPVKGVKDPNHISLTNVQPRVKGLLEIARLNTIFDLVETEADALKPR